MAELLIELVRRTTGEVSHWLTSKNDKNGFLKIKFANHHQNEQSNNKVFTTEHCTWKEACISFKLATSLAFALFFELGVRTIISIFVGHLPNSSEFLSATSLAFSFCRMLPFVITWGFSTALLTLIPQAVGSNQLHLVALHSQRAFVVCTCIGIPVSFILLFAETILKSIGIDSHNDMNWDIVSTYSCALIPFPLLMTYLSILQQIGQNLGHHFAIVIIQAITFVLAIPFCYLFMIHLNMGYIAGALTLNLICLLNNIILFLYLIMKGYSHLFRPFPLHQICDKSSIYQFCVLGLPGCAQMTLGFITKESVTILTGYVQDSSLALSCTAVMSQINCTRWLHCGVSKAFAMRIGQYIGAGSLKFAKRSIKMLVCFESFFIAVHYILYTVFSYGVTSFMTNDTQLISLVHVSLIQLSLINTFGGVLLYSITRVYCAIGSQKLTVPVQFIAQYLITLPLQLYFLIYRQLSDDMLTGLYTVWNISSFGYYLTAFALILLLIFYVDWKKVLQDSKTRIKINNENVHVSVRNKKGYGSPQLLTILSQMESLNTRTL